MPNANNTAPPLFFFVALSPKTVGQSLCRPRAATYTHVRIVCSLLTRYLYLYAGAWTIHIVLIAALKIFYDIIPGVSQETSWTLTNMTYMFGSYLMFHYVRGVPFEFNSGAFDNLNMWEQIDNGAQYTPTKKFLLSVPIVLFLLSTHYTHYDLAYFIINFLAVLAVVIPKLPFVCCQAPVSRVPTGLLFSFYQGKVFSANSGANRVIECDLVCFQAHPRRIRASCRNSQCAQWRVANVREYGAPTR